MGNIGLQDFQNKVSIIQEIGLEGISLKNTWKNDLCDNNNNNSNIKNVSLGQK